LVLSDTSVWVDFIRRGATGRAAALHDLLDDVWSFESDFERIIRSLTASPSTAENRPEGNLEVTR
jgi:hypothetical protein